MVSFFELLLLTLSAQTASAGLIRRYLNTTSAHPLADSSLPLIVSASSSPPGTQGSQQLATTSEVPSSLPFPSPLSTGIASSSQPGTFLSDSTSTTASISKPVYSASSISAIPSSTLSRTLSTSSLDSTLPVIESSGQIEHITSTITLSITKTVLPPKSPNASLSTSRLANFSTSAVHPSKKAPANSSGTHNYVPASSRSKQSGSSLPISTSSSTSRRLRTSSSSRISPPPSSSLFIGNSSSSQATGPQSSQPAPTTASFVLGSSTFKVTVSQGRGSAAASRVPSTSDSTMTVTTTRMSTVLLTTTIHTTPTRHSSSTGAQPSETLPRTSQLPPTQSRQSSAFPTSFPPFSFDPTFSSLSTSSKAAVSASSLPSVVFSSSAPISSAQSASQSSSAASRQASSLLAAHSTSAAASSASTMAGIKITPINPDATTVYLTVTTTDAGVTTTVAGTVTVTIYPSPNSHWHHWGWQGNRGG